MAIPVTRDIARRAAARKARPRLLRNQPGARRPDRVV